MYISDVAEISRLETLLTEYLRAPALALPQGMADQADARYQVGRWTVLVQLKWRSDAAHVRHAIEQLRSAAGGGGENEIRLVVVPRMGPTGGALCAQAGMSWMDLDGNAEIVRQDLVVMAAGRKPWRDRPRSEAVLNAFSTRGARLVRTMLADPARKWSQSELSVESGLDRGYVSKLVRQLAKDGYLEWDKRAHSVAVLRPDLLLSTWREARDFVKEQVVQGTLAARSGVELLRLVADRLRHEQIGYAATGLAAAWQYVHHAQFRIVTVYLRDWVDPTTLWSAEFSSRSPGANLWVVRPKDDGVFMGAASVDGVDCVSPLQTYVDLAGHPERAEEAADEVQSRLLPWARIA